MQTVQPRKSYQQKINAPYGSKTGRTFLEIRAKNLQAVHTGRTSNSVLKFNAVRTAFNAGRTDPQNLDFCAENSMQTVQQLMSRTIPRFLCSRTAFNEAVLFLELCA